MGMGDWNSAQDPEEKLETRTHIPIKNGGANSVIFSTG